MLPRAWLVPRPFSGELLLFPSSICRYNLSFIPSLYTVYLSSSTHIVPHSCSGFPTQFFQSIPWHWPSSGGSTRQHSFVDVLCCFAKYAASGASTAPTGSACIRVRVQIAKYLFFGLTERVNTNIDCKIFTPTQRDTTRHDGPRPSGRGPS